MSLCPFGLNNDPFPGLCARYLDINQNGLCDYSQTATITSIGNDYHFFQIIIVLTLLYSASALLVKKKLITLATHKKIWNFFLLITFFASAALGILLIMKIGFGWQIATTSSLFWHVEAGIAMTVVAFFHTLWHWRYFKNYFKSAFRR